VNIAARLQEVASTGGVAISDDVYRQLRGKLDLPFQDGGERSLKNIAEPVRTWTPIGGQTTDAIVTAIAPEIDKSERSRAARNLVIEINDAAWETARSGEELPIRLQGEMRAVATYCTEIALQVVTEAFRYSGGGAIYDGNILQQCLRDMNVAAQHLMVSEIAYENLGQMILGLPDADPMR